MDKTRLAEKRYTDKQTKRDHKSYNTPYKNTTNLQKKKQSELKKKELQLENKINLIKQ